MTIQDLVKKFMNKGEEEEEDDEPKEIRDKPLESLRRERQHQHNQEEKIELKKQIEEYKKRQLREQLYGIKDKREKEQQILGEIENKKTEVLNNKNSLLKVKSLLKQKSILRGKSLLNNNKEEFKKVKAKKMSFI